MKIHAALITHRHGNELLLAASRPDLDSKIFDYVLNNWDDEIPDEPIPDDQAEAVSEYFEIMAERLQHSEYLDTFDPEEVTEETAS